MQLVNLQASDEVQAEVLQSMQAIMQHGRYVMGPEVDTLEQSLADFVGVRHSVCVSSGTTALLVALLALDVGPGDEVIVPDFTFFAPAEMILLLGATPVPVDIDAATYNMDPNCLQRAITSKTKAIIAVSLFGQCADFKAINALAQQHGLPVIEDAAQSFGAEQNGVKSCALTTIGCASFFPTKPLGAFGDGGAVFCNDSNLAAKIKAIRQHGEVNRYSHELLGINGRMSSFQAAVLLIKLRNFEDDIKQRQRVAELYDKSLVGIVETPTIMKFNTTVCAQYTIQVDDRDEVMAKLKEQGIPSAVHYPKPIHRQPVFLDRSAVTYACPISAAAADRVISLPFALNLTAADVNLVAVAMQKSLTIIQG